MVFSEELPDKESIVPCEDRNKKSQVGTMSGPKPDIIILSPAIPLGECWPFEKLLRHL